MGIIEDVLARQVLDSRGNPTVEVEVLLEDGTVGRAIVPSGASTGAHEAVELRDGDPKFYRGKSVLKAVENVEEEIAPEVIGLESLDQFFLDEVLLEMDGTPNKSKLGANAILGVSMATAVASAESLGLPLFQYLGGVTARLLPVPMLNVLNGGKHADNPLEFQEFMILPVGAESFSDAIRMATDVYHALKSILKEKGMHTGVGDEGGFAPDVATPEEAIELVLSAVERTGLSTVFRISLDVAASEFYKENKYVLNKKELSRDDMLKLYEKLINDYNLFSVEDPFAEDDWEAWKEFTSAFGEKVMVVADDSVVTNPDRVRRGIRERIANAVLVKLNQVGTVSETLEVIRMAQSSGWKTVISHRSGETEDTFIADLAVATNSYFIKTGAPCRSERIAKYNRLLRIEEYLGEWGIYAGKVLRECAL